MNHKTDVDDKAEEEDGLEAAMNYFQLLLKLTELRHKYDILNATAAVLIDRYCDGKIEISNEDVGDLKDKYLHISTDQEREVVLIEIVDVLPEDKSE